MEANQGAVRLRDIVILIVFYPDQDNPLDCVIGVMGVVGVIGSLARMHSLESEAGVPVLLGIPHSTESYRRTRILRVITVACTAVQVIT
jgi:hypothetical protein